uniref:UDP-glucuronosyltransferase n=1 Tax=Otolemur garnettii TaxID=30611 RepID=H0XTB2_OTOGA
MAVKWTAAFLLLQLSCCFSSGMCGKVLVWPTEYSHWINIKTILDELVQRGHEVTVLASSASILVDPSKTSAIKFEVYPTSLTKDDFEGLFVKMDSFWTHFSQVEKLTWKYSECVQKLCEDVVFNKKLMKKLQDAKFDVVLADAVSPCGELLAEILKTPLVYSLRFSPGYSFEKHSGGLPFPPSYVPVILSELSDRMTFMERVKNMIYNLTTTLLHHLHLVSFIPLVSLSGRPTTLYEMMGKAEMWLIRTYWDFEFPRPLLPNVEFVGGLHCKPAKPLGQEIEDFVQSSGENGVVVFSLGSMVSSMKEERANVIAAALAQLPQKEQVLWRFDGKKPDTLGSNTQLYKWLPQNDLLGHPKTKAFVTHGGANGIYEAIYHGVPMLGIPLFGEQADNMAHMRAKGAAVTLDFTTMSSADLLSALKMVINDPIYKENAVRLSKIHHDQPMKPLDRAVFWIEFVMRHGGAKHLRVAAHDLSWAQYHSLDVIGFLLACGAAVMFVITKCCLLCYRK